MIIPRVRLTKERSLHPRHFRSSADLWMNLQKIYDLDLAAKTLGTAINEIPQRPVEPTRARA